MAASGTPGAWIEVSGLRKRFGTVRAVDRLSFTVEPGSVTGFLGPNGAGKTTTLRILLGLVTPDAGIATIGGRAYAELANPTSTVGAVLEAASFHPARSGRNHLRVYCTANGYPLSRADEVLELVALRDAARRPVRGYSLGMRQRLALAGALLGDPSVLVLDEPANGLDPEGIAWMRRFLREMAQRGATVLVSSHVLSEVAQLADQVVIINRGRLVASGALEELARGRSYTVVVRSPQADELATALQAAARDDVQVHRNGVETLQVTGMTAAEVGHRAFVGGVELHELVEERTDLEQIFFALTAEDEDS